MNRSKKKNNFKLSKINKFNNKFKQLPSSKNVNKAKSNIVDYRYRKNVLAKANVKRF